MYLFLAIIQIVPGYFLSSLAIVTCKKSSSGNRSLFQLRVLISKRFVLAKIAMSFLFVVIYCCSQFLNEVASFPEYKG